MSVVVIIAVSFTALMVILLVLFIMESIKDSEVREKESEHNIISDKVVEAMAQKIISDAAMHRKNRFAEEE